LEKADQVYFRGLRIAKKFNALFTESLDVGNHLPDLGVA